MDNYIIVGVAFITIMVVVGAIFNEWEKRQKFNEDKKRFKK
jgi:hypothetical protein